MRCQKLREETGREERSEGGGGGGEDEHGEVEAARRGAPGVEDGDGTPLGTLRACAQEAPGVHATARWGHGNSPADTQCG